MKLIVGLGNPEERYQPTRHNVGFRVVGQYAQSKGATFSPQAKFKAALAELRIDDQKVILALPTTYYNLSGEAVRSLSDFYKIDPPDILIVHDELALPFGTVRTRMGGSPAGNNGIKSINAHLGPETARIRIGIGNDLRDKIDDADFVLANFTRHEHDWLTDNQAKLNNLIDSFIAGGLEPTTHS